jgi:hypothetical protein
MKKKILYTIPVPSTSFTQGAELCSESEIKYSYRENGSNVNCILRFYGVSTQWSRTERCCTLWHIQDTYDTLVEVEDSEWSAEIKKAIPDHLQGDHEYNHYMIYLDSSGCFEFIADSWKLFEEKSYE